MKLEEPLSTYIAVAAEIPEDLLIQNFDEPALPARWRGTPGPVELRELGTEWLKSRKTAVARVPSAITPGEYNFLLNPEHSGFERIRTEAPIPFILDSRMWKER